jgi:hypothetical protein
MKNTLPILILLVGLLLDPASSFAQCTAGQTSNTYCYGDGLVNEVAFEFCPSAGMAAQSTINSGTFGIPPNTLTVYSGASGSGTAGTIVFGPATGDVSGNTIEGLAADQCLIFVVNSIPGVPINCEDGFDTQLQVCSESIGAAAVTLNISPDEFCETDGIQTLGGGLPTGGTYMGAGVTDDNNGTTFSFNPAAAGAGTATVTYTNGGSATFDIEVFATGTVNFTAPADLCVDAGIQSGLGGGTPTGGVYSGPGVTDNGNGMTYTFNPAIAGLGVHTISYTEPGGCLETAMDDIEVLAACGCPGGQDSYFYCYGNLENNTVAFEVCPSAGMAAQANIVTGLLDTPNDNLRVYQGASGSGISGTLLFGPSSGNLAGSTINGNVADNCLIFVINSDVAGSCQDGFVGGLSVCGTSIPASVSFVDPGDFCSNAGVQTGLSGGTPEGGVYSGMGVTDDGNGQTFTFDPAIAGTGTTQLTYTNGNAATVTVEVFQNGATTFTALSDLCIDAGIQSNLSGGSPAGGTFSGPGVTDNGNGTYSFNPAIAGLGVHTITYTDATPCAGTATDQVEVLAACGCPGGETSFFHCYDNNESDLVIFELCPSAGEFAQATINSGSYGIGDNLTVYQEASGSATSGTIVFGPATGNLAGSEITATMPDECLIFVSNSNIAISCQDGLELPLSVCGRSLDNLVVFTALDDISVNAGIQTGLSGGFPTGGVYGGPGVIDDGNGMTYSFDPIVAGTGVKVLTYTVGGQTATDEVEVFNAIPPGFSKSFLPSEVGIGAVSVLTFTIDNNAVDAPVSNLAFTDNLPAGMVVASVPNVQNSCTGGVVTAVAGSSTISYSGGSTGGNSSCTISVNVSSTTPGVNTNTSGNLTSSSGNSGTATADLTVFDGTDRPLFSKSFSPSTVDLGERSTLTFTIDNTMNSNFHFGIDIIDELPEGLVVANPANISSTCTGGVITAVPGTSEISYRPMSFGNPNDARVDANSSCQVTVDVKAEGAGTLINVTEEMTSSRGNTFSFVNSGIAVAALEVLTPPEIFIEKTFSPNPVLPGATTNLEFTLTNLSRDFSATNVSFTDDLSAVLSGLSTAGAASTTCGGTLSGTSNLSFTGGNIPPEGTCTVSVPVVVPAGTALGEFTNTTGAVSASFNGNTVTGNTATEVLFVENVPTITKSFLNDPIVAGGTSTLEFTITNNSPTSALSNINFTDNIDAFISGTTVGNLPAPGSCGMGSFFFVTTVNGSLTFQVMNANIPAGGSCNFTIDVTTPSETLSGSYTNTTSLATAEVDGNLTQFGPATAELEILSLPRITKTFTNDPVEAGETVDLEFTVSYDEGATVDATSISFTDDLNAALAGLEYTGPTLNDICGTGSQLSGSDNLSFTGGTLSPGESCSFTITLQVPADALPGSYTNTTSNLNATVGGQSGSNNPATDDLIIGGLEFTKEFIDNPVLPGQITTLRFTIDNETTVDATGLFFIDNLNATLSGLQAVAPLPAEPCGPGSSITGTTTLVFVGGTVSAGTGCTFDIQVLVPASAQNGSYSNTTSNLTGMMNGSGITIDPATDVLEVDDERLLLTKSFTDDPAMPGGAVTVEYTLTNLDSDNDITNISFTDNFDGALSGLAATGLPAAECGGTVSGTGNLSFSGGTLAAGASCTFSVTLSVPGNVPLGSIITSTTSEVSGEIDNSLDVVGTPASDDLLIQGLSFSKSIAGPAQEGGTTLLTFTLMNNTNQSISDISFTDDLDAFISGSTVVTLPASTTTCGEESGVSGTSLITFTRGALGAGESCSFDVEITIPCGTEAGTYVNTSSEAEYQLGALSTSTAPAVASVMVEIAPPVAVCANPTVDLTSDGTTTVDASFFDGGSTALCGGLDFAAPRTDFDCDDVGNTYSITLTVTSQSSGQSATCTAMVTVEDPNNFCCAPPEAICNNATVELDANGMGSIQPADVGGGSTAECGLMSESVDPMNFSCEDIGADNTVTYTITDINGASDDCTATVTVEDNILPVPVCKTTTVEIQPDGMYTLQEADVYDANASSDNCSIDNVDFPATTYDCDDVDQTFTVTVTVTDAGGNTASCDATITVLQGDDLPDEWTSTDVGSSGALGNAYVFDPCAGPSGSFAITGGGNNATSTTTDNIAFVSQFLCGSGVTITAKIESVGPNGYGGLMIRETTDAGAKQVAIFSNLTNVLRHESRSNTNAPKQINSFYKPVPIWLRLERMGDWVFAYYSTTGASFQYVHAVFVPMNNCVEVGMASFTFQPGQQSTTVFSNVSVSGGVAPGMGLPAPAENTALTSPQFGVSLFPNPTRHQVNMVFEEVLLQDATVTLRNPLGQVVEQRELPAGSNQAEWDVSMLADGIYLFEIRQQGKTPQILRLVKTK